MNEKTLFLTSKELAERWRIAEGTLRNLRYQGKGIPYIKVNDKILYAIRTIEKFEEENKIEVK
uniref:Putative DNA binding, helix-turn-helix domain containing protein n=1 Tax=viral metagenome TaxID=1070528 RepID=A0A6M3LH52_9ZZZZ